MGRGPGARPQAALRAREDSTDCGGDVADNPAWDDALELPVDGAAPRGQQVDDQQRLAEPQSQTPPEQDVQIVSRPQRFLEKLTDVVGLYLNPPQHALVLCVDEKSQIQALDRTQPGLPLKKGRCGTMTHDYKRHGTTTLT